jgi:hypothetical protein
MFQWRLAASGALLLLVFAVSRVFWYPGAYFEISGVSRQLWVLAAVMFVVGPVLWTFIYKPGKQRLVMDLGILGAVELLAVAVVTVLIFQSRPYFSVFAVDRFEAVPRSEVAGEAAGLAGIGERPGHEPRLVYARLPEDTETLNRLIDETVFQGMADIDRRPEFWHPYTSGMATIKSAARPLRLLLEETAAQKQLVENWLLARGAPATDFVFLPLRGKVGDAAIILHADTGFPVASLAINPW